MITLELEKLHLVGSSCVWVVIYRVPEIGWQVYDVPLNLDVFDVGEGMAPR